jgi:hypothetical protein
MPSAESARLNRSRTCSRFGRAQGPGWPCGLHGSGGDAVKPLAALMPPALQAAGVCAQAPCTAPPPRGRAAAGTHLPALVPQGGVVLLEVIEAGLQAGMCPLG